MRTSLIVDLVIGTLLFLGFIRGFKKGFFKRILSIVAILATLTASYIMVSPIKKLFNKNIEQNIVKVENYLLDKNEIFNNLVTSENSEKLISQGLKTMDIPSFFYKTITKQVDIIENETLAKNLAPAFSNILISIVIFISLLIILSIIFLFIKKLFGLITSLTPLNFLDKIIGGTISLFFVLLIISLVFLIIPVLLRYDIFKFSHAFITNALELNTDKETLGKIIYEHNLVLYALSLLQTKL